MLYPRWLETSHRFASRIALTDGATGMAMTFGELADLAAAAPSGTGPVIARSGSVEFFVAILRAWRDGQAVIPVERDAPEPRLHSDPPPGTRLVKHTPGAAGIPRGIFFDAARIAADADRIVHGMGLVPARPNLAAISLSHSYGFSNVVLPLLLHGIPAHLLPAPFPRALAEAFRSHASLAVPAVPSMWRAWHRAGVLKHSPVTLAISAGAPLSLELEHEVFHGSGLKLHNFYGASECGAISFDATETPREHADDAGTPLPGVIVSVSSDRRLLVESDAVASGYDETRDHDPLEHGRYLTHDLGRIDDRGRIRLEGTTGGAINVAGRKVSPAKVEAALVATGLVKRARVFGVPSQDPERVEEIAALLEPEAGTTLDAVKARALGGLSGWELPRHWHVEPAWWALSAGDRKRAATGKNSG